MHHKLYTIMLLCPSYMFRLLQGHHQGSCTPRNNNTANSVVSVDWKYNIIK